MAHSVGRRGRRRGGHLRWPCRLLASQQGWKLFFLSFDVLEAEEILKFHAKSFNTTHSTYNKHCQHVCHCYSGAQDGRRGPASPQAHLSLLLLRTLFPGVHGIVEDGEAEQAAQVEGFPTESDADVLVRDHVSCLFLPATKPRRSRGFSRQVHGRILLPAE